MRIGYLVECYPRLSETFVAAEVDAVRRAGAEVILFAWRAEAGGSAASEHPTTYPTRLDAVAGLPVMARQWRRAWALTRSWRSFLPVLVRAAAMTRHVRRAQLDVLHAHFAADPTAVALLVGRECGLPVTATFHARDYRLLDDRPLAERVAALDAVFCISDHAAAEVRRRTAGSHAASKVFVVRAAVDERLFERRPPVVAPGPIVSVGRLVEKKGHEHLLRAYAELRRLVPDAPALIIVGEGPELERLRVVRAHLGLADDVEFAGRLTHADAVALTRRASVAALMCIETADGDADGIPVFLMEAAAAGVPIVTTAAGGIAELVDASSAVIVPAQMPLEVAAGLRSALGPGARERTEAAAARMRAEFHPAQQADRLRERWSRVTASVAA